MANRMTVCGIALIVVSLLTVFPAWSEDLKTHESGLLTDRLTHKQLETWNRIREVVRAKTRDGRVKHPELAELFMWAEASSVPISVVFADRHPTCRYCGGRVVVEENEAGQNRRATIFVYIGALSRFIPSEGLGKNERYAGVIAHELGHLQWLLAEEERLDLYFEYERQTADCRCLLREIGYARLQEPEPQHCLRWIETVGRELEAPGRAVEARIWRELTEP